MIISHSQMLQILYDSASFAQARQDARRELIENEFTSELSGTDPASLVSLRRPSAAVPSLQPPIDPMRVKEEAVRSRLETMGYRVGWCLAERWVRFGQANRDSV